MSGPTISPNLPLPPHITFNTKISHSHSHDSHTPCHGLCIEDMEDLPSGNADDELGDADACVPARSLLMVCSPNSRDTDLVYSLANNDMAFDLSESPITITSLSSLTPSIYWCEEGDSALQSTSGPTLRHSSDDQVIEDDTESIHSLQWEAE